MKNVILSADRDYKVYSVPDIVAENLEKFCIEFCSDWLVNSPSAEKYRANGTLRYNEDDFIEYLNTQLFLEERSELIENIGRIVDKPPYPYENCPEFNF